MTLAPIHVIRKDQTQEDPVKVDSRLLSKD